MQAKRIFYHRAITVAAVYRPIGYTVLAMMIAAVVIQGCRSGLQYSLSLPSSGAGRQGTPGSLNTLPSAGIDACDVTFAGPNRPGFLLKRSMLKVAMGADGFSPLSSAPSRDMADINRARPNYTFSRDGDTRAGGRSPGTADPKTASDLDRLLEALILAAPEGEGCKAALGVPVEASSFYFTKMVVTAYCPLKCCCDNHADSVTAAGHKIKPGDRFAAAPRAYPFGTRFDIPAYGSVECLDRGGAIKGNKLDLYFDTHAEARGWGIKTLIVKVTEGQR